MKYAQPAVSDVLCFAADYIVVAQRGISTSKYARPALSPSLFLRHPACYLSRALWCCVDHSFSSDPCCVWLSLFRFCLSSFLFLTPWLLFVCLQRVMGGIYILVFVGGMRNVQCCRCNVSGIVDAWTPRLADVRWWFEWQCEAISLWRLSSRKAPGQRGMMSNTVFK